MDIHVKVLLVSHWIITSGLVWNRSLSSFEITFFNFWKITPKAFKIFTHYNVRATSNVACKKQNDFKWTHYLSLQSIRNHFNDKSIPVLRLFICKSVHLSAWLMSIQVCRNFRLIFFFMKSDTLAYILFKEKYYRTWITSHQFWQAPSI